MDKLDVLHQGRTYAVVNKPAGIATERHFNYDTVEARARVQWQREGATKPAYIGIVHRLDRPVSGALVLALRKSTLVKLNQAFAEGQTEKRYRAVTDRPLPHPSGELRGYLGRDKTRKRALVHTRPVPGAREGVLRYDLVGEKNAFFSYDIQLLTGRFHQIRAQLAAAGAPIMGDHAYGSLRPLREHTIALHAYRLRLPDPAGGGDVVVEADFPGYWPVDLGD